MRQMKTQVRQLSQQLQMKVHKLGKKGKLK
jgi:hypothetical protein